MYSLSKTSKVSHFFLRKLTSLNISYAGLLTIVQWGHLATHFDGEGESSRVERVFSIQLAVHNQRATDVAQGKDAVGISCVDGRMGEERGRERDKDDTSWTENATNNFQSNIIGVSTYFILPSSCPQEERTEMPCCFSQDALCTIAFICPGKV